VLTGVAVALSELSLHLVEARLTARLVERGGERAVQFLFHAPERLLPVWVNGRLELARWGCRRSEGRALPATGWASLATFEAGGWRPWGAVEAVIPATLRLDRGVWYRIWQGVRAVAVWDEHGLLRAYPLVEPATHYSLVMTRSAWTPCLVGECI
jgi:hypothetical protein